MDKSGGKVPIHLTSRFGLLFFTFNEVADIFRMNRKTLRKLVDQGEFPIEAGKVGGRFKFRRSEVERFAGLIPE
jgi:excisionase family DNA binding protein